jgi:hypothetical protein
VNNVFSITFLWLFFQSILIKKTMKKSYFLLPFFAGIGLLWMAASGGVAKIQQVDRTGSPVSTTNCTACHTTFSYNTSATSTLLDNGVAVTEYVPGNTYTLRVEIQSTGASGHGFQVVGLLDDNSTAGSASTTASNTQISTLNGREYFEHNGLATGGVYDMTWVAPVAGSGDVTFYGSCVASNASGNTDRDEYANIPSLTISESTANSVNQLHANKIKVYPNPATDFVQISSDYAVESIRVFSVSGKMILSENLTGLQYIMDVQEWSNGVYIIELTTDQGTEFHRVFKN